jgi:adenosylcobinamide kinase/adenosylcobinamide-phosphate guanylyltransferase
MGRKMARSGRVILFIGGARCGKSRLAQSRAESMNGELIYVATAQPADAEMAERIARHRNDRGGRWRTVEVPIELPRALAVDDRPGRVILIDCLTLWLSNLMLEDRDIPAAQSALLSALGSVDSTVLLVTNEVGMGIVPDNALARRFRDTAGRLHQEIAACADEVWLVAAGLGLALKSP